jgi:hypothetical protein
VAHAIESYLPQLRGRNVLLHEDNTPVVATLTKLTTRSPAMLAELRRLWYVLGTNEIRIGHPYIHLTANIWVDTINRELEQGDWQLNPLACLQRTWAPHCIDRFASIENTQHDSTPYGATTSARTSIAYTYHTNLRDAKTW